MSRAEAVLIEALERKLPGVVRRPGAQTARALALAALVSAATVWTFAHLGFSATRLWGGALKLGWLVQFMLPPRHGGWLADFSYGLMETAAMAFLGTLGATVLALPCGFLGARTVVGAWALHFPIRRSFDVVRGMDALVWALIFVNVVGLGPFAGVLALTITNTGDLAKLFAEAIENIERGQVEGVRATGAGRFAEVRLGILPQILPTLLSQSLYYFESNTRSATIIGVVGAGGVGLLLTERIRQNLWDQVAFLLLMILVAVAAIDMASKRIRHRFITGRPEPLLAGGAPGRAAAELERGECGGMDTGVQY